MKHSEIENTLVNIFTTDTVNAIAPGSWQVETAKFRLLVLLSEDQTWLRVMLPIVPVQQAQPFLAQFLEANFDSTQEVRYGLHQEVIWGVFQHNCATLVAEDLKGAIARLISLNEVGLDDAFNQLVENRIRQIILAAKAQGQSLQATMQNLDRFYSEGMMGGEDQSPEAREQVLAAWRRQLEKLWTEVEAEAG